MKEIKMFIDFFSDLVNHLNTIHESSYSYFIFDFKNAIFSVNSKEN